MIAPPKSRAGIRTLAFPATHAPELREHLDTYAGPESTALVFTGQRGGVLRRGNFRCAERNRRAVAARRVRPSEVDPHDGAAGTGSAHLAKPGGDERAAGAHMELLLDDVRGGDRVGLDGPGTVLAGELNGSAGQRPADPAPPEARSGEQAGHRPHAAVALVLIPAGPGDPAVAHKTGIGRPRLDRTPSGRLAVKVGDQAAGRGRVRVTAVGLLTQPVNALFHREAGKVLLRPQLVPLALAPRPGAAPTKDRLKVVAARPARRHDRQPRIRCSHDQIV